MVQLRTSTVQMTRAAVESDLPKVTQVGPGRRAGPRASGFEASGSRTASGPSWVVCGFVRALSMDSPRQTVRGNVLS